MSTTTPESAGPWTEDRGAPAGGGRATRKKARDLVEAFRQFAFKGNVVDLAVGVIIGGAFGKIVSALVGDVLMPFIALVMPSGDWRASGVVLRHALDPKDDVVFKYGDLLGAMLDFFIVALVLFLVVSRLVGAAERRLARDKPAAAPTTRPCPYCLETIPIAATRCR
ncbi:MAG TPA: large conductance mechanosensitive channel protein MscL, partial [Minicystis sp.]|nr:large conductance mechanosensitive channel protein MscL [Minicystis sp.]